MLHHSSPQQSLPYSEKCRFSLTPHYSHGSTVSFSLSFYTNGFTPKLRTSIHIYNMAYAGFSISYNYFFFFMCGHRPRLYRKSVADTHLEGWICHAFAMFSWTMFTRTCPTNSQYYLVRPSFFMRASGCGS